MKEVIGKTFSIARDNAPIPGCTVSKTIFDGQNSITYFSMSTDTDISAEIHPYHKFILVADGIIEVYDGNKFFKKLSKNEAIVTPTDAPIGIRTENGAIYTEILLQKEDNMNKAIKAGKAFKLAEIVPYQKGKIVNMDIVHNDNMKFVLMAFDEGTGLAEHAAPGEALIFAFDGEAVITYEGKDHIIKEGENFHFAKGGLHAVKATKQFKMGLLITLE
ncbi:MAG: cupin domain-containing protein [Fermentimonas sp.]